MLCAITAMFAIRAGIVGHVYRSVQIVASVKCALSCICIFQVVRTEVVRSLPAFMSAEEETLQLKLKGVT